MVFVIQNSANRNSRALHLKLDEIIRATEMARNEFIVAEHADEKDMIRHETELMAQANDGMGTTPELEEPPSLAQR